MLSLDVCQEFDIKLSEINFTDIGMVKYFLFLLSNFVLGWGQQWNLSLYLLQKKIEENRYSFSKRMLMVKNFFDEITYGKEE